MNNFGMRNKIRLKIIAQLIIIFKILPEIKYYNNTVLSFNYSS